VNQAKAEMTWFSWNNHIVKTLIPNVKMFSDVLKRSQPMTYLGIHFDQNLSFIEHIDRVIEKARKGLSAMKVMNADDGQQRILFLW
jgi:hypothetical protein